MHYGLTGILCSHQVPSAIYFKNGILGEALKDVKEAGCHRVQIISDWPMTDLGYVDMISDICHNLKMQVNVFSDVTPDPTLTCIKKVSLHTFIWYQRPVHVVDQCVESTCPACVVHPTSRRGSSTHFFAVRDAL